MKVAGRWCYLYRAIDRDGQLIDSMLSEHRDKHAARRFLRRLVDVAERRPQRVTTDLHPAHRRAIHSITGRKAAPRTEQYPNNYTEQSHRAVKQRHYPMPGFGSFESAARFCAAFDEPRQYFRWRRSRGDSMLLLSSGGSSSSRRRGYPERALRFDRPAGAACPRSSSRTRPRGRWRACRAGNGCYVVARRRASEGANCEAHASAACQCTEPRNASRAPEALLREDVPGEVSANDGQSLGFNCELRFECSAMQRQSCGEEAYQKSPVRL